MEDLELVREIADRYSLESGELRPCVARMLNNEINSLGFKSEHIAYMVAIDLIYIGVDESRIREILIESKTANVADVRSAVQSAKDPKYKRWSCESDTMKFDLDQIRQYFCVEKEHCFWFITHGGKLNDKFDDKADRMFEKYGWHHICPPYEYILYVKIRELERLQDVGTGGLVIASHDKLSYMVGCTRRHMTDITNNLKGKGLIYYRPGDPSRKENRASRIQRVIPIPEPRDLVSYTQKLKEFEQFKRLGRID